MSNPYQGEKEGLRSNEAAGRNEDSLKRSWQFSSSHAPGGFQPKPLPDRQFPAPSGYQYNASAIHQSGSWQPTRTQMLNPPLIDNGYNGIGHKILTGTVGSSQLSGPLTNTYMPASPSSFPKICDQPGGPLPFGGQSITPNRGQYPVISGRSFNPYFDSGIISNNRPGQYNSHSNALSMRQAPPPISSPTSPLLQPPPTFPQPQIYSQTPTAHLPTGKNTSLPESSRQQSLLSDRGRDLKYIAPPPMMNYQAQVQGQAQLIGDLTIPLQPSIHSSTSQLLPPECFSGPGGSMPLHAQSPSVPDVTHALENFGIKDNCRPVDIMQMKQLVPVKKHRQKPLHFDVTPTGKGLIPPKRQNCSPDVFRCTLNAIPSTQAILNKIKLPLGLIVHPFKDLSSLPVISAGTIVRCKRCRTYINPFVDFLDERRWRCNLCFVVNDVPEEFLHHPVTKSYGEPHTRPECTNATLEFIAPQEYMVRPPQPAVYMFLFDVSHSAVETGYLQIVCDALLDHIDHLPGDARTKIGFLTYNGALHYYRLAEGLSQPQMLIVSDLDEPFFPTPDSLLVNLREKKDLVCDLLRQLREIHEPSDDLTWGEIETQSALGAALQAAHKLMAPFGGRVTVFQQGLPTTGPGGLKPRANLTSKSGDVSTELLNPSTDFYKRLALDCSGHQVAIDFFFMNSQFIDIATLSCASRFSGGDLHYYPGLHVMHNQVEVERLSRDLDRYLTRKIGFEAVMRIRCTKGLAIHTFHGNFFVRSTDLLALANINPDAGFGLNLSIEEPLTDLKSVCIQAALLYTSSKGERRIRVHTMCFPVARSIDEIFNAVDSEAVVFLLSKMAVDRSVTASVSDARDALLNAVVDALKAYKENVNPGSIGNSLLVPQCMQTFPLAISCLLKHPAFRSGSSTKIDDIVFSMIDLKTQPAMHALQSIHPDLYRVDNLTFEDAMDVDERSVPQPPLLPLSAMSLTREGVFLLDTGWHMFLHIGPQVDRDFLKNVIGVKQFSDIEQRMTLPDLNNKQSECLQNFVEWLQDQRPHHATVEVVRADSREHHFFMMYMRQDRTESSMSFQEFLQYVQQQLTK